MRITLNWGAGITLVYTLFASATIGFVVFAVGRPVDLVSADYYAESLRLDDQRAATANARALTPPPQVAIAGSHLTVAIPAAHRPGLAGTVTLYRPSDARADRVFPLVVDEQGQQRVALDDLATGLWNVQLRWTSGGRSFYHEAPIFVQRSATR